MTEHRLIDNVDDVDLASIDPEDIPPHLRWTLALDEDGDLRFNETTNRLMSVAGTAAVEQSLEVALATVEGEDPMDEEFGLDIFAATKSEAHLEREIRRALIYDDKDHDRVKAVESVDIIKTPGERDAHIVVTVRVDTGDVRTLRIELPL